MCMNRFVSGWAAVLLSIGAFQARGQGGIPEPGVVVYGRMLAQDGRTTIPFGSAVLRFQVEGRALDFEAKPVTSNGEHYYLVHIPFETRRLSIEPDAPIIGSDPDNLELLPHGTDQEYVVVLEGQDGFFGVPPTPPVVAPLNGDPQLSLTIAPEEQRFVFGDPRNRGKVVRMDIMTRFDVGGDSYEEWALDFFSRASEDGARDADPDGDGLTNEFEYIAGLDPTNANPESPLNRFVISMGTISDDEVEIIFSPRVEGRVYTIRKSSDLSPPVSWVSVSDVSEPVDTAIPGFPGATSRTVLDRLGTGERGFYSVEIAFPDQP